MGRIVPLPQPFAFNILFILSILVCRAVARTMKAGRQAQAANHTPLPVRLSLPVSYVWQAALFTARAQNRAEYALRSSGTAPMSRIRACTTRSPACKTGLNVFKSEVGRHRIIA